MKRIHNAKYRKHAAAFAAGITLPALILIGCGSTVDEPAESGRLGLDGYHYQRKTQKRLQLDG